MQKSICVLRTRASQSLTSFFLLLLLLWAILLFAGCNHEEPAAIVDVDQTTPEATVLSWYEAFNQQDVQAFQALLDPEDDDSEQALKALETLIARGVSFEISDIELDIVENDGQMARVRARYHEKVRVDDQVVINEYNGAELTLVIRDGRWYFIGVMQWPPPGWIIK